MQPARPQQLGIAAAVCVGLMSSGLVLCRTAPSISFGWYAYSPLPEELVVPPKATRTTRQRLGLVLAFSGFAAASAVAGYAIGRSS